MTYEYDFLVVGSGIAGMSFALKVAEKGRVAVICKTGIEEANTFYAQGGIASVTKPTDNFEKHIQDTLICGGGICDRAAVEKVVREAPGQIKELVEWGVNFDRDEKGGFDLHREGGHSEFRILHHQDNTGAEIQDSLIRALKKHPKIKVFENFFAIELITQHHLGINVTRHTPDITCYGVYVLDQNTNHIHTFLSKTTLIATGGIGNVYRTTTNPPVATGDGIAMVYRAKGEVKDMEFIQFHPTALYNPGERPSFLITEAMRGYGAVLRTKDGKEFMQKYDERRSLAPRDIVARAIDNEMKMRGDECVYLDVTHKDAEETKHHFPNIYNKCMSLGIDITKDYIPVAPAAHYLCGGIKVDLNRPLFNTPPARRRRMGLHGTSRGKPPRLQLADRSGSICRCGSQTRYSGNKQHRDTARHTRLERRRDIAPRRNGADNTKRARSRTTHVGIRRDSPFQPASETRHRPSRNPLPRNGKSVPALHSNTADMRTPQHNKRRVSDNKTSNGTKRERGTALHDRLPQTVRTQKPAIRIQKRQLLPFLK